jgi:hypothetical protein
MNSFIASNSMTKGFESPFPRWRKLSFRVALGLVQGKVAVEGQQQDSVWPTPRTVLDSPHKV